MLWSGSAAAALTTALALLFLGSRRDAVFFAFAAIGTAVIAVDDALMLHEMGGSIRLFVYFSMAFFVVAIVGSNFATAHGKSFSELLAISLVFLASSFLMDQFVDQNDKNIYWEDVAKFIGICFWAAFFISRSVWVLVWTVDGRGSEKTL
jgi:hypothetical protein